MSNVIFVCDDEHDVELQWAERLKKVASPFGFDVVPLDAASLLEQITLLKERQRDARDFKEPTSDVQLESASLLIIDSDLVRLGSSFDPNGDDVAYLARCFSNSGPIVILNREGGDEIFDLEVLRKTAHLDDLSISSRSIDSGSLWQAEGTYHPWMWPNLPELAGRLEAATKIAEQHIDKPILEVLGLEEYRALIPKESFSFAVDEQGRSRTFADLANCKDSGLRPKDMGTIPKSNIARFAASLVLNWINRLVLPTQSLIVDCPHLIANCPSLLKAGVDITSIEATDWKRGEQHILQIDSVKPYEYDAGPWLDRKVWLWPKISEDSSIPDISNPFDRPDLGAVFCENISRYINTAYAMAFTSKIDPTIIRYVSGYEWNTANGLNQVQYEPISNLLRW